MLGNMEWTPITLQEVNEDNWLDVVALSVWPDQEGLTPSASWSLAEAYIQPGAPERHYVPLAICTKNRVVGFLSICYDPDTTDCYWINGLLIDKARQGRGYGRAALVAAIERIKHDFPQCREIGLTVVPGNTRAETLYTHLGFVNTGVVCDGEIEWKLSTRP